MECVDSGMVLLDGRGGDAVLKRVLEQAYGDAATVAIGFLKKSLDIGLSLIYI